MFPKEHHLPDKIIYYIEKFNLAICSQLTDVNWRHVPVLTWSFQVLVSLCHDLKTSSWRKIGKNFPDYHFLREKSLIEFHRASLFSQCPVAHYLRSGLSAVMAVFLNELKMLYASWFPKKGGI